MQSHKEQLERVINDPRRIESLAKTFLLDSPPEVAFDRITDLVRRLLNAPLSLVSLVAQDHQYFKSALGLPETVADLRTTPLSHSFCKHTVALGKPLVVYDTRVDEYVKEVQTIKDFGIHTYVGVPLKTPDNQTLGTLCALGFEPRSWVASEVDILNNLAEVVMTEIALRLEVDKQRTLQKQLLESEQRYRSVINEIHDAVVKINMDGIISFVNPAWERILGYRADVTIGHSINEYLERDPVYGSPFNALLAHAASDKIYTTHVHSHDKGIKWFEFRMAHRKDEGAPYLVGLLTDVTNIYRIEAEQEAREHAEQHLKLKNALMSNMTHEFRTPLSAIMSCSEILEEEVTDEQKQYVGMIKQGGERLLSTMDTILLYAQAESGNLIPNETSFNLVELVQDVLSKFDTATIPVNVEAPDAIRIESDRNLCFSILRCIMDNALKFTQQGEISIQVSELSDRVLVSISDTGVGISPAYLNKIFTPFEQFSEGYSRQHEGVGLGLPLTKILVDLLNGTLEIESKIGAGTTVQIGFQTSQ